MAKLSTVLIGVALSGLLGADGQRSTPECPPGTAPSVERGKDSIGLEVGIGGIGARFEKSTERETIECRPLGRDQSGESGTAAKGTNPK